MTSTVDSLLSALGLLRPRPVSMLASAAALPGGDPSRWSIDLEPVGDRVVAEGDLVEARVSLDAAHPIAAADVAAIRFDIRETDWLLAGGSDDPVVSLTGPAATAPAGYPAQQREITEQETQPAGRSLRDVVDDYRAVHAEDFERGILVVRHEDGSADVIAWWRATLASDAWGARPTYAFTAQIGGTAHSSARPLTVGPAAAGVLLRVVGSVVTTGDDPQPVPRAAIALGGRQSRSSATGRFAHDARLGVGASALTVSRPGIDPLTVSLEIAESEGRRTLTTRDAVGAVLGTVELSTTDSPAVVELTDLPVVAHRIGGTITWPSCWDPAQRLPLAGRRVALIELESGSARDQRPATSREWELIADRPGVLRSGRPGRFALAEPTDDSGAFEILFADLTPGRQHLLWIESTDPRDGSRAFDAIVSTVPTPQMRSANWTPAGAWSPDHADRRAVDSTAGLLGDPVAGGGAVGRIAGVTRVLRVVEDVGGARVLHREGATPPEGIDLTPPQGTGQTAIGADRTATGVDVEALPLDPVFEAAGDRGRRAHAALQAVLEQPPERHPHGTERGDVRWVLDTRRAPEPPGQQLIALLERTLLTHPNLDRPAVVGGARSWWRADTVSCADFADIALTTARSFASRALRSELVTLLAPAVPRLPTLAGRRLHLSPGHGVYASPPVGYGIGSNRVGWAGWPAAANGTDFQNWAGEDENAGAFATAIADLGRAAGAVVTSTRETDPTLPGLVQETATQPLRVVDTAGHPDHPRLWQQNAYYWIASAWDPALPEPQRLVIGHEQTSGNLDDAGIDLRQKVLAAQADGADGVDAFVALHSNAGSGHGAMAMYLDVVDRPGGRVEVNTVALAAATTLAHRLDPLMPAAVRSYRAVQGNITSELVGSIDHLATTATYTDAKGNQHQSTRYWSSDRVASLTGATPAVAATYTRNRPTAQTPVPFGYLEIGFHGDVEDALCLAQGWFRRSVGLALTVALAEVVEANAAPLGWSGLRGVLERQFGRVGAVTSLADGSAAPTPSDAAGWVRAATGSSAQTAPLDLAGFADLLAGGDRVVTRSALATAVADAAASVAGWPSDAAHADDRARCCLGPVAQALGAGAPTAAAIPRADSPATRADAAAALAAAVGRIPADVDRRGDVVAASIAAATSPIEGVSLLETASVERPDALVTPRALAATVAAIGRLRADHLLGARGARIVDLDGRPRRRVVAAGDRVALAIELRGAAWPTRDPAGLLVTVTRDDGPAVTLPVASWSPTGVVTGQWQIPAGIAVGVHAYQVGIALLVTPERRTIPAGNLTIEVVTP